MLARKLFCAILVSIISFTAGLVHAQSIDFNSYTDGTALSSIGDVSFSLAGGPGVIGTPTIGLHAYGEGGLINSTLGAPGEVNGYPTTNILRFTFASLVSGISLNIYEGGPVTWSAYDAISNIVSTGAFGGDGTFAIAGSGIKSFDLNNNAGEGDWVFSVSKLDYTVSAVPEPETYAMLIAGLGLMGAIARRRKAKQSE